MAVVGNGFHLKYFQFVTLYQNTVQILYPVNILTLVKEKVQNMAISSFLKDDKSITMKLLPEHMKDSYTLNLTLAQKKH